GSRQRRFTVYGSQFTVYVESVHSEDSKDSHTKLSTSYSSKTWGVSLISMRKKGGDNGRDLEL
ncbi:MAG: hypothetical protein LRZ90_06470, partial [Thermodesulfovibrionales bacterium]|nr:hypothetical protein [Thermodesulfovibrionales bacterium]